MTVATVSWVTVHGPGLAHFSRDQSRFWNCRKLSECGLAEKNVPVPLDWPVNGYVYWAADSVKLVLSSVKERHAVRANAAVSKMRIFASLIWYVGFRAM